MAAFPRISPVGRVFDDESGDHAPGLGHNPVMPPRTSAGILLYRRRGDALQVLLAHPGGPLFAKRDDGHWTIPKGEPDGLEATADELLAVARREFEEETGIPPPNGSAIPLGQIRQKGGKVVHGWAIEGDLDPAAARSNIFTLEWPPRSGRRETFPEIDRVAWFSPNEARSKLKETQVPFVDRLLEELAWRWTATAQMSKPPSPPKPPPRSP
jgi:predicted NUDIX family NTP pyrophosphohydrolase